MLKIIFTLDGKRRFRGFFVLFLYKEGCEKQCPAVDFAERGSEKILPEGKGRFMTEKDIFRSLA